MVIRRVLRSVACALAFAVASALAATAAAQSPSGQIAGTVRLSDGVPLASARVVVTSAASGAVRSALTATDGRYTVAGLADGLYTVTVRHVGYRRMTQNDVRVPAAGPVDFMLDIMALAPVTVTATLREQELTDVPFSIAAPTASMLRARGAENIENIAANVAGFSVQNLGPGQSQVAMRGASSGQIARDQPGVKESVGIYLDDSPVSLSLFTPDLDLFDVSRVEVLRGPQGTLFGAGSLSGTVRYITGQPELGVRSAFGETGVSTITGGGPGADVKLGVNTPLGDHAAARVVGYHSEFGGFQDAVRKDYTVTRNVNSGNRSGGRIAVRIVPNEKLTITPRFVFQNVRMNGWNRTDTFNILANPYTTTRPDVTLGGRRLYIADNEPYNDNFALGDVNLRYDFGGVNLTSVTSYTSRDIKVSRDGGALYASIVGGSIGMPPSVYTLDSPFDDRTKADTWTEELRLGGGQNRARWLLGAFYANARRHYGQSVRTPGFSAATGIPTAGTYAQTDELFFSKLAYDLHQSGVFGEGTVSVTRRFDLTAGLRYYDFSENRSQIFDGFFVGLLSQPGSTKASGLAPRVIASLKATDDITFNAQASRGFRLGGINDPINLPICSPQDRATFGGRDSWQDERVWNYEVGSKALLLGGRASLNLSAYYMDISNLQLTVTAGSCSSRLVYNVPAISRGAEIEFTAAPTQRFDFSLSTSLNNSEVRSTLTSTDSTGAVAVVGGIQKGNRLPSVPRVQAAAAATYRWPMGASQGFLSGATQYIGSRYTLMEDLANGFGTVNMNSFAPNTIGGPLTQNLFTFRGELPAYALVNMRTGVRRSQWEYALFVNNLADQRALLALDRERGTLARVGYLVNQPRTIGVSAGYNY
jgi:iron complex outermembrane receptor protein